MSKYSLLSQSEHAKLRVITERGAAYGDNLMYAMTFPLEFRNIESSYPIFFAKDGESDNFIHWRYLVFSAMKISI